MNFDDGDELNDWLSLVDQDDQQQLEEQLFDNARDYTIIAIDCHPTLALRNMQVKNKFDPTNDTKMNIAQLQNIIQAIVVFLRSQIISSPDSKYAILFYNTNFSGQSANGVYQGDGIYMLQHPNNTSPMNTLSKDYISSLMELENIVTFQQHVGITPYYEGTTQFSSVIQCIQQIYSTVAHAPNIERRVMLFTALENPALMPFYVCMRRFITNNIRNGKPGPAVSSFRGQLQVKLQQIKLLCEQDQKSAQNKLEQSGDGRSLQWLLYPLQSTFPDLFDNPKVVQERLQEQFKQHQQQKQQNTTLYGQNQQQQQQNRMSDSQTQSSLHNTQDTMSIGSSQYTSQSFQPTFGASNDPSQSQQQQYQQQQQQQGIKADPNQTNQQHVSLALGGTIPDSNPAQSTSQLQARTSLSTGSYTTDAFIGNFNLYQDDMFWIQDGHANFVLLGSLPSQLTQQTDLKSEHSTVIAPPSNNTRPVKDEIDGQSSSSATNSATSLTAQRALSIKQRKLRFDPKYFESIFPECDVQTHIQQYAQQLQELKELKQIKQYKKRAITTVPLLFPSQPYTPGLPSITTSYFMGLDVFPQFIETKLQVSSDVKLSPLTKTPIQSKTLAVSKSTGDELNPGEVTHYFPLGSNELVFFGKSEVAAVKDFGPGSLKILGFKEHNGTYQSLLKQLEVGNNIQRPYLCYPSESKYPGSTASFGDFVQMLYTCNRYVVAQFIAKKRSIPRLVYLLPVIETNQFDIETESYEQTSCTGLQLIFSPFYEDLRDVDSVNKVPEEIDRVSDELIEAIDNVLDAFTMSLAPPKYRELEQNDTFNIKSDPPNLYKLQLRTALLESLALGIPEHHHHDELQLGQNMSHVDPIVQQMYDVIRSTYPEIDAELAKATKPRVTAATKKAAAAAANDGDDTLTPTTKTTAAKSAAAAKRIAGNREQLDMAEQAMADTDANAIIPAKPRGRGKKTAETQDVDDDGETKKASVKRGKAAAKVIVESESEEEKPVKSTRGRKAAVKKEDDDEKPAPKKRATRGKKIEESSSDYGGNSDDDEVPAAPIAKSRPARTTRNTRKFIASSEDE